MKDVNKLLATTCAFPETAGQDSSKTTGWWINVYSLQVQIFLQEISISASCCCIFTIIWVSWADLNNEFRAGQSPGSFLLHPFIHLLIRLCSSDSLGAWANSRIHWTIGETCHCCVSGRAHTWPNTLTLTSTGSLELLLVRRHMQKICFSANIKPSWSIIQRKQLT